MSNEAIVREAINNQIGEPYNFNLTDSLEEHLGLDSLDVIEVIMFIERELDVDIEDVEGCLTPQDILDRCPK